LSRICARRSFPRAAFDVLPPEHGERHGASLAEPDVAASVSPDLHVCIREQLFREPLRPGRLSRGGEEVRESGDGNSLPERISQRRFVVLPFDHRPALERANCADVVAGRECVPADGERDAPLLDREVRAFRKRRIRRIARCAPVFAIEIQRCQASLAPRRLVGIERDRLFVELDAVRVPALQAPAEVRETDERRDVTPACASSRTSRDPRARAARRAACRLRS
jgi:hypothetical protein